jgi:hypothetical protein
VIAMSIRWQIKRFTLSPLFCEGNANATEYIPFFFCAVFPQLYARNTKTRNFMVFFAKRSIVFGTTSLPNVKLRPKPKNSPNSKYRPFNPFFEVATTNKDLSNGPI